MYFSMASAYNFENLRSAAQPLWENWDMYAAASVQVANSEQQNERFNKMIKESKTYAPHFQLCELLGK